MFAQPQRSDDSVEFTLENILIFSPSSGSKYKLRLIARNFASEQNIDKQRSKYIFKLPLQNILESQNEEGDIYLLRRVKSAQEKPYSQIGRGKLDFANCSQTNNDLDGRTVNGLIYGTQVDNKDRIIAKFSYKVSKRLREQNIEQKNEFMKIDSLNRRREKLPTLTLKRSIIDRNEAIQNKLNDLTRQLDDNIEKEKKSNDRLIKLKETMTHTLKQFQSDGPTLYYRYSEKMQSLIRSSSLKLEMHRVVIKNIKVTGNQQQITPNLSSKAYLTPHKIGGRNLVNIHQVWLCFYEILESFQFKRKLIEIVASISMNQINTLQRQDHFYLPKTNNRILLEIKDRQNINQTFVGYIKFGSFQNIVEFFNQQNEEKGFIIVLIEQEYKLPSKYIDQYNKQLEESLQIFQLFKNINNQFKDKRLSLPGYKSVASSYRKKQEKNTSRLSTGLYDEKESLPKQKRYRRIIQPDFFGRYKTEQSNREQKSTKAMNQQINQKRSRIQSFKPLNASRNSQEMSSQDSSRVRIRLLNYDNSGRNIKTNQNMCVQSVFICIDLPDLRDINKLVVKYEVDKQIQIKKAVVSHENPTEDDWNMLGFTFNSITSTNNLEISLYLKDKKEGDKEYKCLCSFRISIEQMKHINACPYRHILVSSNKIVGYMLLKFSFNHSRALVSKPKKEQSNEINFSVAEKQNEYQLSLKSSFVNAFKQPISEKQSIYGQEDIIEDSSPNERQ